MDQKTRVKNSTISMNNKNTATVLVTGGTGYIGSHTCKALAVTGYKPVVLDNLSIGHRWAVKWGPLIEGDIGDTELVKGVLRNYDIKAVIHFAANAYVRESMKNPRKYFKNNVDGTFRAFNLDTGTGHSVREVVETVEQITGIDIPFQETHRRHGDPARLVADANQARHKLLATETQSFGKYHRDCLAMGASAVA